MTGSGVNHSILEQQKEESVSLARAKGKVFLELRSPSSTEKGRVGRDAAATGPTVLIWLLWVLARLHGA